MSLHILPRRHDIEVKDLQERIEYLYEEIDTLREAYSVLRDERDNLMAERLRLYEEREHWQRKYHQAVNKGYGFDG
jgi:FtsZ-binding cell division protein ZapB